VQIHNQVLDYNKMNGGIHDDAWMMMVLMEIDVGASFSQVSSSSPFNGLVAMVEILWRRLWSGGATRIHLGGTDE
jgi:hypothetical protein